MNENSHSFHEKELRDGQVSKHIRLGKKVLVWDVSLIRESIYQEGVDLLKCVGKILFTVLLFF